MASTVINPVVNLTMPLIMLLSNKSVNELISATPGTKNKMEVASAVSGFVPKLKTMPSEAKIEATSEAAKIRRYTLYFSLCVNWKISKPIKVLAKATPMRSEERRVGKGQRCRAARTSRTE